MKLHLQKLYLEFTTLIDKLKELGDYIGSILQYLAFTLQFNSNMNYNPNHNPNHSFNNVHFNMDFNVDFDVNLIHDLIISFDKLNKNKSYLLFDENKKYKFIEENYKNLQVFTCNKGQVNLIKYIENPSEDIQIMFVIKDPKVVNLIKNPTKLVQALSICLCFSCVKFFKELDPIVIKALSKIDYNLSEYFKSNEIKKSQILQLFELSINRTYHSIGFSKECLEYLKNFFNNVNEPK